MIKDKTSKEMSLTSGMNHSQNLINLFLIILMNWELKKTTLVDDSIYMEKLKGLERPLETY